MPVSPESWIRRWRALAGPVLTPWQAADDASILGFRDEAGAARRVDKAVLACALGRAAQSGLFRAGELPPDAQAWKAALDPAEPSPESLRTGEGPFTQVGPGGIESWTETELCALHGLWAAGDGRSDAALHDRCLSAAAWHVRELQPDNATARPWAAHVFVVLGATSEDAETAFACEIHADTMTHACCLGLGRPDTVSAAILWHGAALLERWLDRV